MRRPVLSVILMFALLPGCKRVRLAKSTRPATTPVAAAHSAIPVADASSRKTLVIDRDTDPPSAPVVPPKPDDPLATQSVPPPAAAELPLVPNGPRTPMPGKLVVRIYGTPLDYRLDALRLDGRTFELRGQGMRYIGRLVSRDWARAVGTPLMIEPQLAGLGNSQLDLPMVGATKVRSGELVLDEIVSRNPARVKGRLSFTLQGPDGPASFEETFEVDVQIVD